MSANFGGISISAFVMSTATGLRSLACASRPSRCASSGIEPPPQKGSSTGGSGPSVCFAIAARAFASTSSFVVFSHCTSCPMMSNNRSRPSSCASGVG